MVVVGNRTMGGGRAGWEVRLIVSSEFESSSSSSLMGVSFPNASSGEIEWNDLRRAVVGGWEMMKARSSKEEKGPSSG